MLIATQSQNPKASQKYFEDVLTRGDYYLGQEVNGYWNGKCCQTLGITQRSRVTKAEFDRLLEGKHPSSAAKLMQRERSDRRPGVDLTFSVPKSVSLAWAINGDAAIASALRDAVTETMRRDVEPLIQRRVRKGVFASTKQKTSTGNLIYADFLHSTSRPVNGVCDPHLHIHAFVVNTTHDNGKYYAAEMEEIVRQRPTLQAKFESRLARILEEKLHYSIEATRFRQGGKIKKGWEIGGIDRKIIDKYSQRTNLIEAEAEKRDIDNAEDKGKLGRLTREKKNASATIDQLRQEWIKRLSPSERRQFEELRNRARGNREEGGKRATDAVTYALEHHLYRQSTVERHRVVGTALERALTALPEEIDQALHSLGVIEKSTESQGTKQNWVTTKAVIQAEQAMIAYARDGRGTKRPIADRNHEPNRTWLNADQRNAVDHVLSSRDAVITISGGAGTGKTSMMQEATEASSKFGKKVHVFGPSTGARDVLIEKGFAQAETVEHLIRNTSLHNELTNQAIWIDEAGLLDVRTMNAVFSIAKERNARIILSGDIRQHASPRQGEALRILEKEAGLKGARLEQIQRQQGQYRKAVEWISRGHEVVDVKGRTGLVAGFDLLDSLGKVKSMGTKERCEAIASRYTEVVSKGRTCLIVAPTHDEAKKVTSALRSRLQSDGKLGCRSETLKVLQSLNLTEAEKGDSQTYQNCEGMVVQFHQNAAGGFKRGERYRVIAATQQGIKIESMASGAMRDLPLPHSSKYEVYVEQSMDVAQGEKIRFTLGGKTQDGKRIANGKLETVKGFDARGNLLLGNGWTVDRNFAHIDQGYVITSHAAQGKDRDVVIAAMGSESLAATNAKQFYVSVSRGSQDVTLFVDDKDKVRRAIEKSGEQQSATELLGSPQGKPSASQTWENRQVNDRQHFQSWQRRMWSWCRDQARGLWGALGQAERDGGRTREISMGSGFAGNQSPSIARG